MAEEGLWEARALQNTKQLEASTVDKQIVAWLQCGTCRGEALTHTSHR